MHYFSRLRKVLGGEHAARIDAILTTLRLWENESGTVSGTEMGQRLAMARALAHNPSIVFFDDPAAGLDQGAADTVRDLITDLSAQGCTIILSTRKFEEAEQLCDRVALMNGSLLSVAPPAELRGTLPVGV